MREGVLTLRAQPSAIKFAVFRCDSDDELNLEISGSLDDLYGDATFQAFDGEGTCIASVDCADEVPPGHGVGLEFLLNWLGQQLRGLPIRIVGHQLAQGGTQFAKPMRIDDATISHLEALTSPTRWQADALRSIRLMAERKPALAQVACFESAFHASLVTTDVDVMIARQAIDTLRAQE